MSFLVSSVAVLAAVAFFVSCGDNKKKWTLCDTDDDCVNATSRKLKCCVYSFTGTDKICRTLPNELGSYCGGPYFCECDPRKNLTCEKVAPAAKLATALTKEPTECSPPAAGICVESIVELPDSELNYTKYAENDISEE